MYSILTKFVMAALLNVILPGGVSISHVDPQTGPIGPRGQVAHMASEADTVHLIVAGYTAINGPDIGPDCEADLIAVQSMFRKTFQGNWRNRLQIHRLYAE